MRIPGLPSSIILSSLFLLLLLDGTGLAQTTGIDRKQGLNKPSPAQLKRNRLNDPAPAFGNPPPGPVHCVAEWEESEGIMTLWKNADLMNKLQMEHQVYIPVDSNAEELQWIAFFNKHRIPLTNVHFLYILTNTMWTRDYGPWFVWDANNEMGIVNYTCNYGYLDDLFPSEFAKLYGIHYYESGLYHVGGNYYPNAFGRAFSSTHVYESNPKKTKAVVDQAMADYYGITKYRTVAPKDIWHHDTWGKPADPETLIIVDFPEYDKIRHAQADGMRDYYATLESPWGRPYEIHRLPMMPDPAGGTNYRPYMNSLVSNKQVFVPIHDCPDDAVALKVFQDAFVGYDVVGVIAKECEWHDALHCRTRNFVKREVIRLYPLPPGDTEETAAGYTVTCEAIPPNGSSLLAGYPVIRWTITGGAPFTDVVMQPTGKPDEYAGDIPAQALGTEVSFYIEAKDDGNREAIYPLVAPKGMMSFEVRTDSEAPVLSRHVPVRSVAAKLGSPRVRTLSKDDMATPEVILEYRINGVPQPDRPLTRESLCWWYNETLAGQVKAGDVIDYRLRAHDGAAIPNETILPPVGRYLCPVAGKAPVGVVNRCGRPYTEPFLVDALGDLGLSYHVHETWPADFSVHDTWFILLGVFADNHVLTAGEAQDLVDAMKAGKNIYLEGGNTWCNDPERYVICPWFGVTERIKSKGLKLLEGTPGSIMDGLKLSYASEDLKMDVIAAVPPAFRVLESATSLARAVFHDGGTYRSIAATFALGGLLDREGERTRKEILVRYLELLGHEIDLHAMTEARMEQVMPVILKGDPGESYILFGSLAEDYQATGFGPFRLDPGHLFVLAQGVIPASGVEEIRFRVPLAPHLDGYEAHLQAVVGKVFKPSQARLTNRDIVKLVMP